MRAWRSLLPKLALSVGALLTVEVCSRTVSTFLEPEPELDPGPGVHTERTMPPGFVYSARFGWLPMPGGDGFFLFGPPRHYDRDGFLAKDAAQLRGSTRKVVVVGDSTSFGYGVDADAAFAEVLERQLRDVAVINLGVPGYSSYQGLQTLVARALPLKPSVVIISFNFNDRRAVANPREQDGSERFASLASNDEKPSPDFFRHFYTYRLAARLFHRDHFEPPPQLTSDLRTLTARVPPEAYRANLARIVELAQAGGARVIFLLLGDNPDERVPRQAIELIDQKQFARAVDVLTPHRPQWFEWIRLRSLSLALEGAGEKQASDKARKVDWWFVSGVVGGPPLYPDFVYQAIMREVASSRGVPLVDGDSLLGADPTVFLDNCHFNELGHRRLAEALLPIVRGQLDGPGAPAAQPLAPP